MACIAAFARSVVDDIFTDGSNNNRTGDYLIGMYGGMIAYTGLMVWDFVDGAMQTNKYNASLEETWSVQPTAMNAIDNKNQRRILPGLALRASF